MEIARAEYIHKPSTGVLYPQLDGLRALAILSVVFGHVFYFNPNASKLQAVLHASKTTGGMGVSIFFVLSGFLITQSLLSNGKQFDMVAYSVRRAAKIYPPFLLTMLLFGVSSSISDQGDGMATAILANLASIPNFISGFRDINAVHWSLWVEIQFYVILPLFCVALGGMRAKQTLITAIVFLIVAFAYRMHLYMTMDMKGASMKLWVFLLQRTPGSFDGGFRLLGNKS